MNVFFNKFAFLYKGSEKQMTHRSLLIRYGATLNCTNTYGTLMLEYAQLKMQMTVLGLSGCN